MRSVWLSALLLLACSCDDSGPRRPPLEAEKAGADKAASSSSDVEARSGSAPRDADEQAAAPAQPRTEASGAADDTEPAAAPAAEVATVAEGDGKAAGDGERNPALLDPAQATGQAPDEYSVKVETTKGDFIIDVKRAWAPLGADRFYNLVRAGFYSDVAFFRVVENFMAQVGIHGDPSVAAAWRNQAIKDDPVKQSNLRGYVTFATAGKDSRVTQFFINFVDNSRLDPMGFAPFGKVRDMSVVDKLYAGYGEGAPRGRGPAQGLIEMRGNAYLKADFPKLDYIESISLIE